MGKHECRCCCDVLLASGGALKLDVVQASVLARWSAGDAPRQPYGQIPRLERGAEELVDGFGSGQCSSSVVHEHGNRSLPLWMNTPLQPSQRSPRQELPRIHRCGHRWLECFESEALLHLCVIVRNWVRGVAENVGSWVSGGGRLASYWAGLDWAGLGSRCVRESDG